MGPLRFFNVLDGHYEYLHGGLCITLPPSPPSTPHLSPHPPSFKGDSASVPQQYSL